ncbi:hypothetical protein [Lysinibacillus sp. RC79]|uniref:hypothetical protein n=1 Tax=Lysinibacillus sp. RC79 TaxID=3156296 RepID=UPI0035132FF9
MSNNLQSLYNEFNSDANKYNVFWEDHRKEIHSLIEKVLPNLKIKNNAIVIGVGNGNDLPLLGLANQFNSITLLDIDGDTLKETAKKIKTENKFELINTDLSNINQKYLNKFIHYVARDNGFFSAKKVLEDIINDQTIFPNKIVSEKFNLVISSTVSTQLVSPYSVFARLSKGIHKQHLITKSDNLAEIAAEKHIEQINNLLDTESDSYALVTSEQFIWSENEDNENPQVAKILSSPEQLLDKNIQNQLEADDLGIKGRITEKLLVEFDIVTKSEWIWQFNEKRYYLVKGWILKLKK